MNRERLAAVAVAALAVLALGAAAATLEATSTPGGGGLGAGDGSGPGAGEGPFSLGGLNASDVGPSGGVPVWLYQLLLGLVLLGGLVGLYQYYREHGLARVAKLAVGLVVVQLLVLLLVFELSALDIDLGSGTGLFGEGSPSPPGGGAPVTGAAEAVGTLDPPTVLLALLGLVLLGAVAAIYRLTDDDDRSAGPDLADDGASDVSAVGRAAGRAADRIAADADVTNQVYRAWREMTEHLDVENPEASTPAEFAAAGVAAGMSREDVAELTSLFESVRYGDAPATDDREERALAALRRIERTYAGGEAPR